MNKDLERKFEALHKYLLSSTPATIAVSGGLDSRLLSFIASKTAPQHFACIHFSGPHLTPDETRNAKNWLKSLPLSFNVIAINPLAIEEIRQNSDQRCYYCKRHIFSAALRIIPHDHVLMDGTNASDLGLYRPGLRALKELDVVSPFALSAITKEDIKALAIHLKLPNPTQTARPCLLTRFPYDIEPTTRLLETIANLEDSLAKNGWDDYRVRVTPQRTLELHAHPKNQNRPKPDGLRIVWTNTISGYFDTQK